MLHPTYAHKSQLQVGHFQSLSLYIYIYIYNCFSPFKHWAIYQIQFHVYFFKLQVFQVSSLVFLSLRFNFSSCMSIFHILDIYIFQVHIFYLHMLITNMPKHCKKYMTFLHHPLVFQKHHFLVHFFQTILAFLHLK